MVLMNYIKSTGSILALMSGCLFAASDGEQKTAQAVVSYKDDVSKNSSGGCMRLCMGLGIGTFVGSCAAYKVSERVQHAVDSSCEAAHQYLKNSLAPRIVMKIEKMRDEGLKGTDVMKVGCVLGPAVQLKNYSIFST